MNTTLKLFILYYLFVRTFCERSLTVQISQGLVRGYLDPEEEIFIFYNVPYATTPKGIDRFKAPLPAPVWNGTFEAVNRQIVCPQNNLIGILPDYKIKHEDCLVLNIYVPDMDEKNLPVVVYVHGGGFAVGWADLFTFKNFVRTQKVIVVSLNYRLSAHGFLCLGTKDIPGNAGLKDQIAALKWVNKNIKSFGGNPDDVTLHGCSAGSSSVDIMIYSKMAKGLFKGVVADSGSALGAYTVQSDPIENAKIYAKLLGYNGKEDINSLESYYQSLPFEILTAGQVMKTVDLVHLMTPCVERDLGQEMFLEDNPVNLLKKGNFIKTPMLYGFTDMEGIYRIPEYPKWKYQMNSNFSIFLPGDLHFKSQKEKELVGNAIKQHYFGDKEIGEETVYTYVDYFSDILVIYPLIRSINLQLEAGSDQIYLYEYSYFDNDTDYGFSTHVRGATHCAQTFAVMDGFYTSKSIPYDENLVSNKMLEMKSFMRKIWGSFVKTGNPIPENSDLPRWRPMTCKWTEYMSINKTMQLRTPVLLKRVLFWNKIYNKYYNDPHPPQTQLIDPWAISDETSNSGCRMKLNISYVILLTKLLLHYIG